MKRKCPDGARVVSGGRRRSSMFAACLVAATLLGGRTVSTAQEDPPAAEVKVVPVPAIRDAKDPGRSVSTSRQFIIYAEDWRIRGDYSVLAEEVKASFLKLFHLKDEWEHQVVISLKQSLGGVNAGRPVEVRANKLPDGFRFVMRVEIGDSLNLDDVREELLHLLMYEYILKQKGEVREARENLVIPVWMRTGISGAIRYRAEMTRRDSLYRAIFQSGKMLSINEILRGRPEEATSVVRALYDASAAGLVTTLLDQRDGIERMKALMRDLLKFDGTDYALLKKHFPDLDRSNNSLEKWWALQIATLAEPTVLDILSISETEAYLQKALLVNMVETREVGAVEKKKRRPLLNFGKKKEAGDGVDVVEEYVTYDLVDFENFIKRDDIARILNENEMKLMSLSYRAFPLYRPLIRDYQIALEAIKKGKSKGLAEKLEQMKTLRTEFVKVARDTEDYVHLYEATTPDEQSGAFDAYFELFEKLHRSKPKREDDISIYLDKLNREWEE